MLDGELEIRTLLRKWFTAKKNPKRKLCDRCANNGKFEGCNPNIPIISCIEYEEKPLTNADRIRAMTDEELAGFLDDIGNGCDNCPKRRYCLYETEEHNCHDIFLKWLKEEVEE